MRNLLPKQAIRAGKPGVPNKPVTLVIALLAGAAAITGYAPFYFYPSTMLALAVLFYLLSKAQLGRDAAWLGYAFGLGFFCSGVSWIYVSLHVFGGMPWWMAGFATFTFCAFLALFTAMVGWLSFLSTSAHRNRVLLAAPLLWVLFEWIRSWIFTGFPWLNVGYSQIPLGPLAGYAPVLGIYGVSLFVALAASLLVLIAGKTRRRTGLVLFVMLWISASALKQIEWTTPVGKPIRVALLQGNIAQDIKWDPQVVQSTLDQYLQMVRQSSAQLIVMPETALPVLTRQIPELYLQSLQAHARQNQGDILIGAVESVNGEYFNSMLSVGNAADPRLQYYRKSHLVPFGEYIPLKAVFGWIYRDWLNMPLTDLSRGDTRQQPLQLAGQQVAVNICYEDVFGEEIIRQLPKATLLVNASNDAWYGESLASYQHLQMSQTRALESGRMMLRATNTGATAIIDTHGNILQQLPHFTQATLESTAQGYEGMTPYIRWGNWPALCFVGLSLLLLVCSNMFAGSGQPRKPA